MAPVHRRGRPQRTCVQCGAKGDKDRFLRVAGRPGKSWEPDPGAERDGRGFYLCRGTGCIEGFAKSIRTPKGARRFRIGSSAAFLADTLEKWRDRF